MADFADLSAKVATAQKVAGEAWLVFETASPAAEELWLQTCRELEGRATSLRGQSLNSFPWVRPNEYVCGVVRACWLLQGYCKSLAAFSCGMQDC